MTQPGYQSTTNNNPKSSNQHKDTKRTAHNKPQATKENKQIKNASPTQSTHLTANK